MNAKMTSLLTLCLGAAGLPLAAVAEPRDGRAFDVASGVDICGRALSPTGIDSAALMRDGWSRVETRQAGDITETNWTRGGRLTRMIVLVRKSGKPLCGFTLRNSNETEFRLIEGMIAARHGAADMAPDGGESRVWTMQGRAIMLAGERKEAELVTKVLVSQL